MSGTRISAVFAYEALDSRGRPTVACVVHTEGGCEAEALAPAGASTGRHEARELRDGDERHAGLGVRRAVAAVNGEVAAMLLGMDSADQRAIDAALRALDGTDDLGRLGANGVIATSLACLRAGAATTGVPLWQWVAGESAPLLPMPMVNMLSGGAHAGRITPIQDFLVIPVGASSVAEALEWACRVRAAAAGLLHKRGGTPDLVADEGGLAHPLRSADDGFELLTKAIERAGLRVLEDVALAVDVAATQLLDAGGYRLSVEAGIQATGDMVTTVAGWARRHALVSIEDPLSEDDWAGWVELSGLMPDVQLIGDDLLATSATRLQRAIDGSIGNAVLAKINQNGTVSGTADVVRLAQAAGYNVVVSARSGETEDSSIADLAVGWRAGQIKVGSTMRSERTAKWNRLLRIEAELGDRAQFAGRDSVRVHARADARDR